MLMILFVLLGLMMDVYIFLYSPLTMLIKRNTMPSLMVLLAVSSGASMLACFFYLTGERAWGISAPFLVVLVPLAFHLYRRKYNQLILIDMSTGEIKMASGRKINIQEILYLELYSYDQGGYTYEELCFVLRTLQKVSITGKYLGIETMIKELTRFLSLKCVDSRT